jgi:hypothetical protein
MGQPPYGHATTPDPGSTLAQSIALANSVFRFSKVNYG